MASQKIKLTEAERKRLSKALHNLPKELPRQRVFEHEYYHKERSIENPRRERPLRGSLIMTDKINHCKSTGGMSECSACQLKSGEKHESQKKCHFYQKNTYQELCTFEIFGEYCWCVDAQDDSKKG